MIIAIEGIDGAGKFTLTHALEQQLSAETLSFPRYDDSIHAQLAQNALYGKMGDLIDSVQGMATMFALDRRDAAAQIAPFKGSPTKHILLDRYVASNAAYTAARMEDAQAVDWVKNLEFSTLGVPKPDLQILLNTPPALAAERARTRENADSNRERDRYERDSLLQAKTSAMYEKMAQDAWVSPWVIINPDDDITTVIRRVATSVTEQSDQTPIE